MLCDGCNNPNARIINAGHDSDGNKWVGCEVCINARPPHLPDVYFNPKEGHTQTSEHICYKNTGIPIPFWSKTSKAAAMKQAGVRQADSAEKQHGMRNEEHLNWKKRKSFIGKSNSSKNGLDS